MRQNLSYNIGQEVCKNTLNRDMRELLDRSGLYQHPEELDDFLRQNDTGYSEQTARFLLRDKYGLLLRDKTCELLNGFTSREGLQIGDNLVVISRNIACAPNRVTEAIDYLRSLLPKDILFPASTLAVLSQTTQELEHEPTDVDEYFAAVLSVYQDVLSRNSSVDWIKSRVNKYMNCVRGLQKPLIYATMVLELYGDLMSEECWKKFELSERGCLRLPEALLIHVCENSGPELATIDSVDLENIVEDAMFIRDLRANEDAQEKDAVFGEDEMRCVWEHTR